MAARDPDHLDDDHLADDHLDDDRLADDRHRRHDDHLAGEHLADGQVGDDHEAGDRYVPYELDPDETPLGTRRVSRGERVAAASGRAATRTRERRPAARERRPVARDGSDRPSGRRPWRRRLAALALLGVFVVLAAAAWFVVELYQPFESGAHGRVTVVVPKTYGASQIGDLLAKDGVIPSGFFFNLRASLAGDRGKLYSGTYHLRQDMSYAAVLKVLTTPPPVIQVTDITIAPGHTRSQISALLKAQGIQGDYAQATVSSPLLNPTVYGAPANTPSLEGFLYPDTYQLRVPVKMSGLIADQLKRFRQLFAKVDTSYAASQHLTPYDVLIIASLLEGEAQSTHDMQLVASVIYNRLRDGILLGMDSTTRYATGNFTAPLTQSELNSSSPWNTRNHAGLPPTPINNPDLQVIHAAAHPPTTNYLYFVNKPCSTVLAFSSDYNQFLNDVAAFNATQSQDGAPPQKKCH